jgi:hypothetical protein
MVGDHLDRGDRGRGDRPLKAPPRSLGVARCGHQHVDDLPDLINGAVDLAPPAGDLHGGFVELPAVADGVAAGPGRLDRQRGKRRTQREMVVWSTWMSRSASSSTTSRHDSAKRSSQPTASTITSGGKHKPAKPAPAMEGAGGEAHGETVPARASPTAAATGPDAVLVGVAGVDGEWLGQYWRRRCLAWVSMASQSGVSVQAGSATGCQPPATSVRTRSRSGALT